MEKNAEYWIENLNMQRHPEGGYFVQTYKASHMLNRSALPLRYSGDRSISTTIYFLLTSDNFSSLHWLASDEMWHFYTGSPLTVYMISPEGERSELQLGSNFDEGQKFQGMVPAGYWFGSKVNAKNSYALVGCTVSPGFEFEDFKLADRRVLSEQFPQHKELIEMLTRM